VGLVLADRAAVFIDGAYLTKILDVDFGKPKIDLGGFSDILCGNYELQLHALPELPSH
jgi:hypothetical protein